MQLNSLENNEIWIKVYYWSFIIKINCIILYYKALGRSKIFFHKPEFYTYWNDPVLSRGHLFPVFCYVQSNSRPPYLTELNTTGGFFILNINITKEIKCILCREWISRRWRWVIGNKMGGEDFLIKLSHIVQLGSCETWWIISQHIHHAAYWPKCCPEGLLETDISTFPINYSHVSID